MKFVMLLPLALGFGIPNFVFAQGAKAESVHVISERIEPLDLRANCKLVRSTEPKGDLTYKVARYNGVATVTRPIYSDLCETITQQFTTRLYSYFSVNGTDDTPVIGFSADDGSALAFPEFSAYVVRAK